MQTLIIEKYFTMINVLLRSIPSSEIKIFAKLKQCPLVGICLHSWTLGISLQITDKRVGQDSSGYMTFYKTVIVGHSTNTERSVKLKVASH